MIGIDICSISRFSNMKNLDKFLKRYFTNEEIDYILKTGNRDETIAGIFSLKEAFVKAIGTGFGNISPIDVEIIHNFSGKPDLIIHNEIIKKIEDLYDLDKHQEIIDMIEALPTKEINNELIGKLARAYIMIQNYEKAIEVLKSIEKEEKNTMLWNYRMGCSYFYLEDYEKAEEYFLKAYNLEPEDENIKDFLMDIYINLSKQVKFRKDDLDNQKKALNYALKAKDYMTTDDKKIECYSYLAFLYNKFTEYSTAEELLKEAAEKATQINRETDAIKKETRIFRQRLQILSQTQLEMIKNEEWDMVLNTPSQIEVTPPTIDSIIEKRAKRTEHLTEEEQQ